MSAKSEAANKILQPIFGNLIKTIVKESAQPITKIKLASNGLRRIFTGEAAVEKQLNKLAKQRILQQKGSWRPTQKMRDANLEGKKQAIRDAKAMRSAASKAELEWMQNNADKATKVYKSGAMEFGGDANRLALLKARQEAMKPFIKQKAKEIRKKRLGYTALAGILPGMVIANKIPFTHQLIGQGVQMLPDDLQHLAYQAGPYVRQWIDYNTGGQKYGLEMSPKMGEQYLQDVISERMGNQNYQVGDTINNTPTGSESRTFQKYMKAGGDSARVADAMYSQLGNIEHVVIKPNNKLQVIDAYDWEPMDTKEGYEKRIEKIKKSLQKGDDNYSTSDLWRVKMERPAQWAAEHNLLAPDMNKINVRSKRKHDPNLKPKAWVGYDFEINQKQ